MRLTARRPTFDPKEASVPWQRAPGSVRERGVILLSQAISCKCQSMRWPRKFEQGAKWNLGLKAGMLCLRIRSDDEEASPPEPHTGL
jgi:hypothetical protein